VGIQSIVAVTSFTASHGADGRHRSRDRRQRQGSGHLQHRPDGL